MFMSDHSCHDVMGLYVVCLSRCRKCFKELHLSHTHTHMPRGSFSSTNQEGHQVKGYKARARAKEKVPVKEQEGAEKREPTGSKIK